MKNEFTLPLSRLDLMIERRKEALEARLALAQQREGLRPPIDLQNCIERDKSVRLGNAESLQVQKEENDLVARALKLDPEAALNQFLKSVIHSIPVPDRSSLLILKVRRGWFSVLGHNYFVQDLSITNISEIICVCDEERQEIHVYPSNMIGHICSVPYPERSR